MKHEPGTKKTHKKKKKNVGNKEIILVNRQAHEQTGIPITYEEMRYVSKVKYLYLYWITLSATRVALPRGPVRTTPYGSNVTTLGNRSTLRKPAMLGRIKLGNTLLTCGQGNFNQTTARTRSRTLITVVRDTVGALP